MDALVPVISLGKDKYFVPGADLNASSRKYCRCLVHVAEKQPHWCLKSQGWFKTKGGEKCANPYAICSKSVHRKGSVECSSNFNYDNFTDSELRAYMDLKKISIPGRFSRSKALNYLDSYFEAKSGGEQSSGSDGPKKGKSKAVAKRPKSRKPTKQGG